MGQEESTGEVFLLRYVLIVAAVKIASIIVFAFLPEDIPVPSSISNVVTIAAVILAMGSYGRQHKRPLTKGEIVKFALGVMIAEWIIMTVYFAGIMIVYGLPFSMDSLNAMFPETSNVPSTAILWIAVIAGLFGSLVTFATSALFAWLMTRKLGR